MRRSWEIVWPRFDHRIFSYTSFTAARERRSRANSCALYTLSSYPLLELPAPSTLPACLLCGLGRAFLCLSVCLSSG